MRLAAARHGSLRWSPPHTHTHLPCCIPTSLVRAVRPPPPHETNHTPPSLPCARAGGPLGASIQAAARAASAAERSTGQREARGELAACRAAEQAAAAGGGGRDGRQQQLLLGLGVPEVREDLLPGGFGGGRWGEWGEGECVGRGVCPVCVCGEGGGGAHVEVRAAGCGEVTWPCRAKEPALNPHPLVPVPLLAVCRHAEQQRR